MAVMAITGDDDLLAVRAGRHARRRYQHLTTSQAPVGGLAIMTEMVGPVGRSFDFSEPAVQQAPTVASALGLTNVHVVAADLNDLDPATLGGPFDLAWTRLFLMHQPDLVRTLRRIAQLLRPGGWLIAQEPLRTRPPRSHPDVAAHDLALGMTAQAQDDTAALNPVNTWRAPD